MPTWIKILIIILLIIIYLVFIIRKYQSYLLSTYIEHVFMNNNKKLNEIQFVGSHNSSSYKFISDVPLPGKLAGQYKVNTLNGIQKWCAICQRILAAWTFTQQYDVYDQLKLGVRALDLRVAFTGREYVYAHTLANEYTKVILGQIKTFIDENPDAFIIISSKPEWENRSTMETPEAIQGYLQLVGNILGSKLLPKSDTMPTLGSALNNGHQVLFIYHGDTGGMTDNWIWPSSTIYGTWYNESNMDRAYRTYSNDVANIIANNDMRFRQTYLVTTPDTDSIKDAYLGRINPFSSNIITLWKQGTGSVISNGIYSQRKWLCQMLKNIGADKLKKVNIWWIDAPQSEFIMAVNNINKNGIVNGYCT